jgi:hypothetical protein
MDYYCYISQNKVDQLYDSLTTAATQDWTQTEDRSTSKGGSIGSGDLLPWLNAELSYGRKDTFRRSVKLKETYVHKLRRVLLHIRPDLVPFEWRSVRSRHITFYHHSATFRAHVPQGSTVAELQTSEKHQALLLHCSMKYFSDHPGDETLHITSSNYAFFNGDLSLEIDTVFFLLHQDHARFVGSPLFIKLAPLPGLIL